MENSDSPATGEPRRTARLETGDATPHRSPAQEWVIRVVAVVALGYSLYYIAWRWTESLNPDALWFAIPLALAETWGIVGIAFFVFTVAKLKRRVPPPAPEGLSVDVFITTYDEPLEVIRRTALGAREIGYPHRTTVLDDGKRDEVRALAEELGIGYLRREGNEHAKAGNLNHALQHTTGEFILQLDADHVPLPHILDRMLGFFKDPRVAFVQTPQDFYNVDSFMHDVNEKARRLWNEQRIFFSLIQPGKDHWGAAFFCGSCGVIRRSALEQIGGFSTETITEDMETSLLLHSRGWKSVFYGESLAYGLAPGSADAFHIQRLRWGQGAMQIWRKFNPLTLPGLSWGQRICYFASVSSYLDGIAKLVLYLSPVVFLLTGVYPIAVGPGEFLVRFIPYFVLSLGAFELLSRGMGFLAIAERYNMAKFFTYILSLTGYFARGRLKFNVTPKGESGVSFASYAPQLAVLVLSVGSLLWAIAAHSFGWIDYGAFGWGSTAFWFNAVWIVWNSVLAAYVVHLSLRMRQQRIDYRFTDRFPVGLQIARTGAAPGDGAADWGPEREAVTEDLNPYGMSFRSVEPLDAGTRVRLTLPLSTRTVEVTGEVVHQRGGDPRRGFSHGVRFDPELAARDAIELHCVHHTIPLRQLQYRTTMGVIARTAEWVGNARAQARRNVSLPARITVDGDGGGSPVEDRGTLDEISRDGARLLLDHPIHPGSRVSFHVPDTDLEGRGTAVYSSALETPLGVRFAVGVQRDRST